MARKAAKRVSRAGKPRTGAARKNAKPRGTSRRFKTLAQVRAAIDAMDVKIVPLLCERLHYVTQAAQFKPSVEGVVVLARVEEVVENARRLAARSGGNPATIEAVYRVLIDAFTLEEQDSWRRLHGEGKSARASR